MSRDFYYVQKKTEEEGGGGGGGGGGGESPGLSKNLPPLTLRAKEEELVGVLSLVHYKILEIEEEENITSELEEEEKEMKRSFSKNFLPLIPVLGAIRTKINARLKACHILLLEIQTKKSAGPETSVPADPYNTDLAGVR